MWRCWVFTYIKYNAREFHPFPYKILFEFLRFSGSTSVSYTLQVPWRNISAKPNTLLGMNAGHFGRRMCFSLRSWTFDLTINLFRGSVLNYDCCEMKNSCSD